MGMKIDSGKAIELLLAEAYITPEDLKRSESFAGQGGDPLDFLLSEGVLTKELLGQAIAESFKASYASLANHPPSKEQILRIPEATARKYGLVLFREDASLITLASCDPSRAGLGEAAKKLFPKRKIAISYCLPQDLEEAFLSYRKALTTRFSVILKQERKVAPEIINAILEDAAAYQASDIHFEPQSEDVLIRFRIDGVMQEAGRLPKPQYENVVNRIKVQAHLRIDEHFSPQDGAMRFQQGEKTIDIRVSIAPTIEGEKVAMRLLGSYVRSFDLEDIGLLPEDLPIIQNAAKKPFGMILVTGPTGSGKTTTLYALLKLLNRSQVNITTIEDPVEYHMGGVNQIQVSDRSGIGFAEGLRSIVRQDPDIILVGEIRDRETAEIGVNAALTGHLLLSTFHANDAPTAIPRLLDMGIEPFLLASTLELIVAQRLVRLLCRTCRYSVESKKSDIEKLYPQLRGYFQKSTITLYQAKGCAACNHTGYKGRSAIFQFIPVSRAMQDLIVQSPSSRQVWKLALSEGSRSLFDDGLAKVRSGKTTLEELLRIAQPMAS